MACEYIGTMTAQSPFVHWTLGVRLEFEILAFGVFRMDRLPLGLPSKISVDHVGIALEISRKWFGAATVVQTVFTVFWCGFLVFWYTTALETDAPTMML